MVMAVRPQRRWALAATAGPGPPVSLERRAAMVRRCRFWAVGVAAAAPRVPRLGALGATAELAVSIIPDHLVVEAPAELEREQPGRMEERPLIPSPLPAA